MKGSTVKVNGARCAPYLAVLLYTSLLCGCGFGDYRRETFYYPYSWESRPQPVWGASFGHKCNNGQILLNPILLQSEKTSEAIAYIPMPSTSEADKKSAPNSELNLTIKLLRVGIQSCSALISVKIPSKGTSLTPKVIDEVKDSQQSYCTYLLPTEKELTDEFVVEFNSDETKCSINPVKFRRKVIEGYHALWGE